MVIARREVRFAAVVASALLLSVALPAGPAGAQEDGRILFAELVPRSRKLTVLSVNPDGTELTKEVRNANFPAYSPDATRIAFVKDGKGKNKSREIFVIDVGSNKATQLTNDPGDDVQPDWSPDGTKIVWNRDNDIWVMNPDGSEQVEIFDVGSNLGPSWSPDGSEIVFSHHPGGVVADRDLFAIEADGSGAPRQLTGIDGRDGEDRNPHWSPDGTQIVYEKDTCPDGCDEDVWVVDSLGLGVEERLFGSEEDDPDRIPGDNRTRDESDPVWSPDGTKVAFECDINFDFDQDICVVNADGGMQTPVAVKTTEDNARPDWGVAAGA